MVEQGAGAGGDGGEGLGSPEGRLRWLFQQIDDPGSLWAEHRTLYEAIAAGDADAAAACSLQHIRHYRDVAVGPLFDGGA